MPPGHPACPPPRERPGILPAQRVPHVLWERHVCQPWVSPHPGPSCTLLSSEWHMQAPRSCPVPPAYRDTQGAVQDQVACGCPIGPSQALTRAPIYCVAQSHAGWEWPPPRPASRAQLLTLPLSGATACLGPDQVYRPREDLRRPLSLKARLEHFTRVSQNMPVLPRTSRTMHGGKGRTKVRPAPDQEGWVSPQVPNYGRCLTFHSAPLLPIFKLPCPSSNYRT